MSVVGNFALGNNDRTTARAGIGERRPTYNHHRDYPSDTSSAKSGTPDEKTGFPNPQGGSDEEEEEAEKRDREVSSLARKLTTQSTGSGAADNPFEAEADSILNPHSPNFKPRAWAKSLLGLQARDPDKYKSRTAGFSFSDLNVHGFGSATDYQKSVGNIPLEVVGLVRRLLGQGQRRIEILRNLEGVINHGEMLVVLGPPGRYRSSEPSTSAS